jgi:hypothetical protein
MATYKCYRWGKCDVLWKNANWKWSECQLIEEIISAPSHVGVDASQIIPPWLREEEEILNQLDREKRRRFIRLMCRVKNVEYKEEKLKKENIKISIDDIKLVVKAVANVDLQIL